MSQTEVENSRSTGSVPEARKQSLLWRVLAAITASSTIALGVLSALGAGTGPFGTAIGLLLLVCAFVLSISKTLSEELRHEGVSRRRLYVGAVVATALVLTAAGLATKAPAPLEHMSGTEDVAIVGFKAPSPDLEEAWAGLSSALAHAIGAPSGGSIRDYSADVEAPLSELIEDTHSALLSSWTDSFLAETGAELVIGGAGEATGNGQIVVHVSIYVPARLVADAYELSGWIHLRDVVVDHEIASTNTRRDLIDQISAQFEGIADVIQGLDAWNTGHPDRAIDSFDRALSASSQVGAPTLTDLALLFRGHALENEAGKGSPANRQEVLQRASRDYSGVGPGTDLWMRARLSLAANKYLQTSIDGCKRRPDIQENLKTVSTELGRISTDITTTQLVRLKAEANRAQVELCREVAGAADARPLLESILQELTTMHISKDEPDVGVLRQVKAFSYSISATHSAALGSFSNATSTIEQALALEPRFERQALWLGLQSGWMLKQCRTREGRLIQQESLAQLRLAIQHNRVPSSELATYTNSFAKELSSATQRCGGSNSGVHQ